MTLDHETASLLPEALRSLEAGFSHLPEFSQAIDLASMRDVLLEVAERMRENYPYHHPLYVGQMLKPPHPLARAAYALALWINPNNHALDGGRASSQMEKEAVAEIARMFGWDTHLGHLCGGGTMANFEALWVARELRPGKTIAASSQAHYTHSRLSSVLAVPFQGIDVDGRGRMAPESLEAALQTGDVGTVVVTLGSTAAGAVDPLPEILALRRRHGFRLHVDAAYGGYFTLAENLGRQARDSFDLIREADSIAIDPHKHGLQPYGCGCVLYRDPSVGSVYRHESPYTYFTSDELHLGEISLECSRPGAAAVALWATHRLLPPVRGGRFARDLASCRDAAMVLFRQLTSSDHFVPLFEPQLDIVVWAVRAASASESSARAKRVFEAAAARGLHLALAKFPRRMLSCVDCVRDWDQEDITCLRACVMKPEHRQWMPEIVSRLMAAVESVG
jgi:tyrosine decarboxylase/aspartate 1-decarboxylase